MKRGWISRYLRPAARGLIRWPAQQSDLLLLGVALILLQESLDRSSLLSSHDWRAWIVLTLSACAALRGRSLGMGPHPDLRVRGGAWLATFLLATGAPWWVWSATQLLTSQDTEVGLATVGVALRTFSVLSVVGLAAFWIRRRRFRSAWAPRVPEVWWISGSGVATLLLLIYLAGRSDGIGSMTALAAACLLAVSLALGDPRNLAQRWASWHGRPLSGVLWHEVITIGALVFIPAVGLEAIWSLMQGIIRSGNPRAGELPGDGFAWAILGTLYVLVWTALAWPRRRPIALAAILHEVAPGGGRERRSGDEAALKFSEAPQGALAVEPLDVERKGRMHPWLIAVDSGRAASAELRSRELWSGWQPSLGHALGRAMCAEDGIPGVLPLAQWDEVTIEPQAREATETLEESQAGTRRRVILRPFARPLLAPLDVMPQTFAWQGQGVWRLKQVDAGGRCLRLAEGDVIVLSAAGVVRCFQFEPGCPVDSSELRHVPQPEDFLESGT